MKALRVNKKLWTEIAVEDFTELSACDINPIVVPYGVCGCGGCCSGCCCLFLCVVLIC